jgi:sortase A
MAEPRGTWRVASVSRAGVLTAVAALVLIVAGLVILLGGPDERPAPGSDVAGQQAQAAVVDGIQQRLAETATPTRAGARARRPLSPGVRSLVTIPRLDLAAPVRAGTDAEALAGGLGHWQNGVRPGGRGNFVLAGHRVTETEPFAAFPTLRPGDRVRVRTSNALYTYVLDTSGASLRVDQHAVWVTGDHPAGSRTDRVLTLITCAETFHTDDRLVTFGHLVSVQRAT